jgi:HAD superfamily hydrolase (TIGR01509 family)
VNTVIAFDLGKVLVDFDYAIAARRIAARCSRPPENLHAFLGQSPLLLQLETGGLTRQEFFDAVREPIGFQGSLREFSEFFAEIFTPIEPMIALHAELRRHGFATYIFSNTNDLAIEAIRRDFPFFKNFDGYIFSYEVGAMKPQAGIYEALEKMTGKRGGEILYIDDRPENIAAGEARGWESVLHESPEKTRATLQEFLK